MINPLIRLFACAVASLVLLAPSALGQGDGALSPLEELEKRDENLPKAEEIYERYTEAIGGSEAVFALRNRVHEGLLTRSDSGAQQWLTMTYVAPNKLRIDIEEPGGATYAMVYDGEIGWVDMGKGRARLIVGQALVDLRNDADFYGEANYKKRYTELETETKRDFHGRDAYWVSFRTKNGAKPGVAIFDVETGLLLATRTFQAKEEGLGQVESRLRAYEEFEGVRLPTEIVQIKESGEQTRFVFRRTRVNVADVGSFERPETVKQQAKQLREQYERQKRERDGGG